MNKRRFIFKGAKDILTNNWYTLDGNILISDERYSKAVFNDDGTYNLSIEESEVLVNEYFNLLDRVEKYNKEIRSKLI